MGVIQPGRWRNAETHWLSVSKDTGARTSGIVVNAGARATNGRTGNIVGMLGPRLPVDVPAALWECWCQGLDPPSGWVKLCVT